MRKEWKVLGVVSLDIVIAFVGVLLMLRWRAEAGFVSGMALAFIPSQLLAIKDVAIRRGIGLCAGAAGGFICLAIAAAVFRPTQYVAMGFVIVGIVLMTMLLKGVDIVARETEAAKPSAYADPS